MFKESISPHEIGFDIDGVVADTMGSFILVAKEQFGYSVKKEDITSYILDNCLDIPPEVLYEIVRQILDDPFGVRLEPIEGAREVLLRISSHNALTFVTARPDAISIKKWLFSIFPELNPDDINVIATGRHAAKLSVLKELGLKFFLKDNLETCEELFQNGIRSIVFDQPWNRDFTPFLRVKTWDDIQNLIRW
jgi:5'(3')-deoxyribonucleotidase